MRATPGTKVKRGGVYNIIHYGHRVPHRAILQEGESFPIAGRCGTAVLFDFAELVTERDDVEHIGYDLDFMDWVLQRFARAG